jgi:hypothetical protein
MILNVADISVAVNKTYNHFAPCYYADCCIFIAMLSASMLNSFSLSIVAPYITFFDFIVFGMVPILQK